MDIYNVSSATLLRSSSNTVISHTTSAFSCLVLDRADLETFPWCPKRRSTALAADRFITVLSTWHS